MGKKGCAELLLLLLSMLVFWLDAKIHITIHVPSQRLAWDEARQYCQSNYIDMVTWYTTDTDLMTTGLNEKLYNEVWIGLHRDSKQPLVWRWINVKTGEGLTGDDVSESRNWALGHQFGASCGSYNTLSKKWQSTLCITELPVICFADNLVVVNKNKTWEDALNHCREMSTASSKYDLLSITNSSDYSYVSDRIYRATTEEVWTGLRFLGGEWWWSDGETLDHQGMLPDCPSQWEHCGTMSKYNTANWITRDCSERRNFICYYTEVAED